MHIEHLAIRVADLELMKNFYAGKLGMTASTLYHNPKKHFRSYFLSYSSGARLELMQWPEAGAAPAARKTPYGLVHFAISVGSKAEVDRMTEALRREGIPVTGEPRTTGDGCYESVIQDPEGNQVELTE